MMMGHGKKDKIVPGIDILIRPAKTGIMMGEGMMNMKMMD